MALIYIVEDDVSIREIETIALRNSNYDVRSFGQASEFYKELARVIPDLVLLDIMLPDEDGYQVIRRLRADPETRRIPVIMVTAKTTEMDMVKGLDEGADDYIRKPFSVMEMLSRVRALLRRTEEDKEKTQLMTIGGITLDHERHIVQVYGTPVELTYKEYELLRFLMGNREMVQSRETITFNVWGTEYEGGTRTVDMHVKTLRQKLGVCGRQIETVRNVGYVLRSKGQNG